MTRTVWVLSSVAGANEPNPRVLGVYSSSDRAMDAATAFYNTRHPRFPWIMCWTEDEAQTTWVSAPRPGLDASLVEHFIVSAKALDGAPG